MNRRAFLRMLGVASIAVALPPISKAAAGIVTEAKPSDILALATREPLTTSFIDTNRNPVGPSFLIPPDWWYIENGVARLRNSIECVNWPGPACTLMGLRFYRSEQWIFEDRIDFGFDGGAAVTMGEVVQVNAMSLKLDGMPKSGADEMLRRVLL